MSRPNQTTVFASFVLKEAAYEIFEFWRKESLAGGGNSIPLTPEWLAAVTQAQELQKQLKEEGTFYHNEESVFGDYKNLRRAGKPDDRIREIFPKFRRDMGTDEIWQIAEGIINEWQQTPGIERKG